MIRIAISYWGKCITLSSNFMESSLAQALSAKFDIVPISGGEADFYLGIEHSKKSLKDISKTLPKKRRFLATFEPKSVHPQQYKRSVRSKYGEIIVASPLHTVSKLDTVFGSGGLSSESEVTANLERYWENSHRQAGSVGFVNANKFSMSIDSRYVLRRDVASYFARNGVDFTIGGPGWDRGLWWETTMQLRALLDVLVAGQSVKNTFRLPMQLKNNLRLLGEVPSSIETLSKLQVAIVIENEPTYITEKIFNAIQAGCIVLYHGPRLEDFGITEDVCFQCGDSPKSFLTAYKILMSDPEMGVKLLKTSRAWIENPETRVRWGHSEGIHRLVHAVENKIDRLLKQEN